ncbi:MAG: TetR/AcrR family transcriptional regulator [Myxococcota bacterium]
MTPPRRTPKGEATRQRLLNAAGAELVANDGVVEIAAVAQRAGVSPSLLYKYFAGKGELVAAVVESVFERFDETVMRPELREVGLTWIVRERERVRRFVTFFYDDPLALTVVRLMVGEPEAAQARQSRMAWQTLAAAQNIRRGQAAGDLPIDVDADVTAAFLMGGLFESLSVALTADPVWERQRVTARLQGLLAAVVAT